MSVLCDSSIREAVASGEIVIEPFRHIQVQPASYDLRVALENTLELQPNKFYLLSTMERIRLPRNLRGEVHGRSSVGRKGVLVHFTAGYVDPEFSGYITLEVMALSEPFLIEPGDRLAQIAFTWLDKPASVGYTGRYQNQYGPTPSKFLHGDL